MSYDLTLRPSRRKKDTRLPSTETVTGVLLHSGAERTAENPSRLSFIDEAAGEVDIDLVVTPAGVARIEVSTSSEAATPTRLYRFAAAAAEGLEWEVYDPQGDTVISPRELKGAAATPDDLMAATWIGPKTLLTSYLFLPLAFVWVFKGASSRSVLFPLVVLLGIATVVSLLWEKYWSQRH